MVTFTVTLLYCVDMKYNSTFAYLQEHDVIPENWGSFI